MAQPGDTGEPGLDHRVIRRFRRPLQRGDHRRSAHRLRAPGGGFRRLRRCGVRTGQGPGARRLPTGQHALRPARIVARSDGGGLADRHLGFGPDRRGLLPGVRAEDRGSPRPLRRTAAGLSRRFGRESGTDPRGGARGRAAAEFLRGDDGDRLLDAGGAHRPWRSDVPDHAGPAQQPRPRHRSARHPRDRTNKPCAATGSGRRGRAPSR